VVEGFLGVGWTVSPLGFGLDGLMRRSNEMMSARYDAGR
jgi:hypothetical protein